jgi:hypothetical protein
MKLALNVYTDETLKDVKRVAEADRLRVPYRVAIYIGESLDKLNFTDTDSIFNFVTSNLDKLDKIIKATFGLSEAELDCVDVAELSAVGVELYKWGIEKLNGLKSGNEKNAVLTAEQ